MSFLPTAAHADPTQGWQKVSPADIGLAPTIGDDLDRAAHMEAFEGLHAVVVVRAGKLALERYYSGVDERWGEPLGNVT
ncbi:MAG: serine hydrolase domain-containing protein, partial [Geminicoccaceae bacterium]